jgi:hypothetical protein
MSISDVDYVMCMVDGIIYYLMCDDLAMKRLQMLAPVRELIEFNGDAHLD